jgi:thiamine-monophosphate kinase
MKIDVSRLGERGLIEKYVIPIMKSQDICIVGDDCAVVSVDGVNIVSTIDLAPRRCLMHALEVGNYEDYGHYCATMSWSDIASMGANPISLTAAIAMPSNFNADDYESVLLGIKEACTEQSALFVGGDTKEGTELRVATSAIGMMKDNPMTRVGGDVGDVICASGYLGRVNRSMLEAARKKKEGRTASKIERSKARIQLGMALSKEKIAVSCMDMSDGPIQSVRSLASMNGLIIRLDVGTLPMVKAPSFVNDVKLWKQFNLSTGSDYELMFICPPDKLDQAQSMGCYPCGEVIGRHSEGAIELLGAQQEDATPWQHFSTIKSITEIAESLVGL